MHLNLSNIYTHVITCELLAPLCSFPWFFMRFGSVFSEKFVFWVTFWVNRNLRVHCFYHHMDRKTYYISRLINSKYVLIFQSINRDINPRALGVSISGNKVVFRKCYWQTDAHALLWGHWHPCFEFMVMSSLGFKAQIFKNG